MHSSIDAHWIHMAYNWKQQFIYTSGLKVKGLKSFIGVIMGFSPICKCSRSYYINCRIRTDAIATHSGIHYVFFKIALVSTWQNQLEHFMKNLSNKPQNSLLTFAVESSLERPTKWNPYHRRFPKLKVKVITLDHSTHRTIYSKLSIFVFR